MDISTRTIDGLNETDLRRSVLLPLFVAMGFKEVTEYHGPEEYGKDLVMWMPDVLRSRQNFAVVAKAAKIDSRNSAEVLSQIQQCFQVPFRDPVSGEERTVQKVIVVTSKKITANAQVSIRATLRSTGQDERVDFLDGDLLVQRLGEFMPSPRSEFDPDVLAGHFEALVAADWRQADHDFWDEMRTLQERLISKGRFGGSLHSFERQRICERQVNHRSDLLVQRAGEVLGSPGAAKVPGLGERIRQAAVRRLSELIDSLADKLDDSAKAGQYPPLGRPELHKEEVLAALDARLSVVLSRSV